MKSKSFLAFAAAFALAVAGLSIPSPVLSSKALAQTTNTNGQAAKGKKATGTANNSQNGQPKGKLYKSPGDRMKCRMGNC
jgi:hypothetical protein